MFKNDFIYLFYDFTFFSFKLNSSGGFKINSFQKAIFFSLIVIKYAISLKIMKYSWISFPCVSKHGYTEFPNKWNLFLKRYRVPIYLTKTSPVVLFSDRPLWISYMSLSIFKTVRLKQSVLVLSYHLDCLLFYALNVITILLLSQLC